jgi:hypothetical protein
MLSNPDREAKVGWFIILLVALVTALPNLAQAKGGGPLHLFRPFTAQAEAATIDGPKILKPSERLHDFSTECGHGRYRNPVTHICRGPADR